MNINWYGKSFFYITSQKDKKSSIEVAVEPFGKDSVITPPKTKPNIVIIGEEKDQSKLKIEGNPFVISGPGEYEVGGVFVQTVSYGKKSFSLIEAENIRICHLGGFDLKEVESEHLDIINGSDILMIPINGKDTIDFKEAAKIVSQIEPKIVIPMDYDPNSKDLKDFLKTMGIESKEEESKLSVKEKDFIEKEGTEVVVLNLKS